jgi:sugar O-acyltransferase (sialic acid O-acetyltransferase NeuD family)
MKPKLILIGAGGHCVSAIDAIELQDEYAIEGILDNEKQIGSTLLNYPILGNDDLINFYKNENYFFLITVGQIRTSSIRLKIALSLENCKMATIISPLAYISKHATIDKGSVVLHRATINAGATIGKHCIINTQANIEHGVSIENFCHISTGAMINGDCVVKKGSFIGSNATLVQGKIIEENTVIGAGQFIK